MDEDVVEPEDMAREWPSEIDGCPDIGHTRRRSTFEFIRNQNLVDVIEPFIGPEISCNPVSHVRPKMPATDVAFHQDALFTTQEAKDILQLTVWLPLVAAIEENGCLQVQPRVHQQRVVYWTYSKDLPDTEKISLPMQKGDVPATWADATLLKELTGYAPQTNVREGIRQFVAWYRDYYRV